MSASVAWAGVSTVTVAVSLSLTVLEGMFTVTVALSLFCAKLALKMLLRVKLVEVTRTYACRAAVVVPLRSRFMVPEPPWVMPLRKPVLLMLTVAVEALARLKVRASAVPLPTS